jgi:archaellum component FlaC
MSEDRRGSAINPAALPQALGGLVGDIREIADQMKMMVAAVGVLPKVAQTLSAIEARVDTLDDEVREMHAAVEAMRGDVTELRGAIARVEPHLEEVTRIVHPLRRITDRARRRGREGAVEEAVEQEIEAEVEDLGAATQDPADPLP